MLGRKRSKTNNENLQELPTETSGGMGLQSWLSGRVPEMGEISASAKDFQYLACPYSLNNTADSDEMKNRYEQVTRCTYKLLKTGLNIYSPITYHHAIQRVCGIIKAPTRFWLELDFGILKHAKGMFVLMLDGWQNSIGVTREIEFCRHHDIPISFIHPDAYILTGKEDDQKH